MLGWAKARLLLSIGGSVRVSIEVREFINKILFISPCIWVDILRPEAEIFVLFSRSGAVCW
jgi:hypothetical protein